jgi:hypothetical protein
MFLIYRKISILKWRYRLLYEEQVGIGIGLL